MGEIAGWRIETCKGPLQGCAHRAAADDALATDIDAVLRHHHQGAVPFARVGGRLKVRREFTVAIADCANACSRPQIADLGLIGAVEPEQTREPCHQCLGCVHACREGAITHAGRVALLDLARCVRCGACCRVCLSGALQVGRRGWRILLGGKLGRHPRLGVEVPGLFSRRGVLAAVTLCAEYCRSNAVGAERFGDLLARVGAGEIVAAICERAPRAEQVPPRAPAPVLRGPV